METNSISIMVAEGNETIIATDVSFDTYMKHYAADFCEWIDGVVIKMSPVHERHDILTYYLRNLLQTFTDFRPIAMIRNAPFSMKMDKSAREPDLQIILNDNPNYTPTGMYGAADICIEVVSPESVERDHGTKFAEYEAGGVQEYWIIDPVRNETRFYRLNDNGVYISIKLDENNNYRSPQLPDFVLHVPTLWQEQLPTNMEILETVKEMISHPA